jgi:hypothetical protein
MVFQIQDSIWTVIYALAVVIIILVVVMLTALVKGAVPGPGIFLILAGIMISCVVALVLVVQNRTENDDNFSRQLMDEYHVTSNRSLSAMKADFTRHHGSNVIFTRDGKDTQVFVKQVASDDKKITMAFTVIDDKALYPKPSK